MQVKKFEARTMKEALEMIKRELGPEAIILGVKDNRKKFGLVGEGSVEVSAAISEEAYAKKKFVEQKLPQKSRDAFLDAPPSQQRRIVQDFVEKYQTGKMRPAPQPLALPPDPERLAKREALAKGAKYIEIADEQKQVAVVKQAVAAKDEEIKSLRQELQALKGFLTEFREATKTQNQNQRSAYPGADYGLTHEFSFQYEKLLDNGVLPDLAAQLLLKAQSQSPSIKFKNRAFLEGWVVKEMMDQLLIGHLQSSKVHVFAGPPGSGKTTAMIKIASHEILKNKKKVALLTADQGKVGSVEQMRIYAQILNAPFGVISKKKDWSYFVDKLKDYDYILCDFPGLGLKSEEESSTFSQLLPHQSLSYQTHLVISAMLKTRDILPVVERYQEYRVSDLIFTNLDQCSSFGLIYNLLESFKLPSLGLSSGPRVPEDFEYASKERLVDLILDISKDKMLWGKQQYDHSNKSL